MREFNVYADGLLEDSDPYYKQALSRRAVYAGIIENIETLSDYLENLNLGPFQWLVSSIYQEELDYLRKKDSNIWPEDYPYDLGKDDEKILKRWIKIEGGENHFLKKIQKYFDRWLDEEFPYGEEIGYEFLPFDGVSSAFIYFFEDDLSEILHIDCVEGSHPGDNGQYAFLTIPVNEANKICKEQKLEIKFTEVPLVHNEELEEWERQNRKDFFEKHGMTEQEWYKHQWEETVLKLETKIGRTISEITNTIDLIADKNHPYVSKIELWKIILTKALPNKKITLYEDNEW